MKKAALLCLLWGTFCEFLLGFALLNAQGGPVFVEPGYESTVFYGDPLSSFPTGLTEDDQGRIYVSYFSGEIRVLQDLNHDLQADAITTFWGGSGIQQPLTGILWHAGKIYISYQGAIATIEDVDHDLVGDVFTNLVTGLPHGLHQNNGLFASSSHIYFGLGSITDHAVDPDPRSATLMEMSFDGSQISIYASGLRNVYDGIIHPQTGEIFVGDNGPNMVPGNPHPPDEIDRVLQGHDYGHPFEWGITGPGSSYSQPLADLIPHSAPTGMTVNNNKLLSGFRDEVFLTAFGGGPLGGLVRVPIMYGALSGLPGVLWEPFILNLQNPIDCLVTREGVLLVAEYSSKTVLAITQQSEGVITLTGQPSIGMTCGLTFQAKSFPGQQIYALASHDLGAPIVFPNGLQFYLELNSPVVALSLLPGNGILSLPFPGILDNRGVASGSMTIPNIPGLVNSSILFQFAVVDQGASSVLATSPPLRVTFLPPF